MTKEVRTAEMLTDVLKYIEKFRGTTFVIKLGGNVMLDKKVMDSVSKDIVLLNYVGIKVAVVHGGGPEITRAMEKFGKKPKFAGGLRYTDKETLDIVKMVLLGNINTEIVSTIHKNGANAVGLSGEAAGLFLAKRKKTHGEVGDITSVQTGIVHLLINNGYIPVISPIALDEKRMTSLNVNADIAAGELAIALNAEKLILLTDVDGVLDKSGKRIERIRTDETGRLIKEGIVTGGMIPKLMSSASSVQRGVKGVHIVKAQEHAILGEVFTSEGTGTMIY